MTGIYKITSPTGRVYVGQSTDLSKRRYIYSKLHCTGQHRLYSSLKKYGFSNHTFEVVEECEESLLNMRERFWQDYYSVTGEGGLNLKLTQTDTKSGKLSDHSRKLISESQKRIGNCPPSREGAVLSDETKQKIRDANKGVSRNKGYVHTQESKQKMSLARLGTKHLDETKQKIRDSKIGRPLTLEHRKALLNSHTKYVDIKCYTLEGNLVATYSNLQQAVSLGFTLECIRRCILGRAKKHRGFVWKI
jgi:group I intron endonuclease